MKLRLVTLCLLLAGSLPLTAQAQAPAANPESRPLTAAVLDFQTSGEKLDKKGSQAAVLLNAMLSSSPSLILVERQDLEKILGEQELGLSGTVNPDTAARVGDLTGAQVLITGRLFDAGDKFFLVAKIMSTETSRVFGETATFTNLAALDKAVEELSGKVQSVVEKQGGNLVPKVETTAQRIDRLRKIVEGKTLPSVSVAVSEQHLTRALIDPAVDTEMKMVLQDLGFQVIETTDSTRQPDVRITGEAISEFGARRGNLVSAIARVEVKAVRQDGSLLAVDRQRGVAVDLAEAVAAKEALQGAALKILERLVPKLVSAR
jgi:hypothetical protein